MADNLFGLTYREITNDLNIQEATPGHPELAWFQQAFDQIRKQFPSEKRARIFYNPVAETNAIAFRDLRHKGVMIYGGLLQAIVDKNQPEGRIAAIKGMLARNVPPD